MAIFSPRPIINIGVASSNIRRVSISIPAPKLSEIEEDVVESIKIEIDRLPNMSIIGNMWIKKINEYVREKQRAAFDKQLLNRANRNTRKRAMYRLGASAREAERQAISSYVILNVKKNDLVYNRRNQLCKVIQVKLHKYQIQRMSRSKGVLRPKRVSPWSPRFAWIKPQGIFAHIVKGKRVELMIKK